MGLAMIYTAMPVTNAVPYVVAAPPGIVTRADLPHSAPGSPHPSHRGRGTRACVEMFHDVGARFT